MQLTPTITDHHMSIAQQGSRTLGIVTDSHYSLGKNLDNTTLPCVQCSPEAKVPSADFHIGLETTILWLQATVVSQLRY